MDDRVETDPVERANDDPPAMRLASGGEQNLGGATDRVKVVLPRILARVVLLREDGNDVAVAAGGIDRNNRRRTPDVQRRPDPDGQDGVAERESAFQLEKPYSRATTN